MEENEKVLSASLFMIGGMDNDSGGATLEDRLLPLKEIRGTVREVFEETEKEGAEVLSVDPFVNLGPGGFNPDKWRNGERITYVRSPVTGNFYEHIFEWDAHPFFGWSSGAGSPLESCAAVFYEAPGFTRSMEIARLLAREERERLKTLVKEGRLRKLAGIEGTLGEVRRLAREMEAFVVRVEAPVEISSVGDRRRRVEVLLRRHARDSSDERGYELGGAIYLPGLHHLLKRRSRGVRRIERHVVVHPRITRGSEGMNSEMGSFLLARAAQVFSSRISVRFLGREVNLKSQTSFAGGYERKILAGDEVEVIAEGGDAEDAVAFICDAICGEVRITPPFLRGRGGVVGIAEDYFGNPASSR